LLVLAIEPDSRQAAILKRVVRERARADITVVDSKDEAIATIASRVPDLILVTALLSPRDEEDLVGHLRTLDEADHLQTITIPLLATAGAGGAEEEGGFFKKFRRKKNEGGGVGCDPWAFADQVNGYLRAAAEARAARLSALAFEQGHQLAPLSDLLPEARGQESEVRGQRPEARGRESEARGQRPEARGEAGGEAESAQGGVESIEDLFRAPAASFGRANPAADVAELREQPHTPEPVQETSSEPRFNDPDYAFSWRSSEKTEAPKAKTQVRGPRSKVRGQKSKVQGPTSEVPGPASHPTAEIAARADVPAHEPASVILPPVPVVPEPEPVFVAPEPIAFVPEPEPVLVAPEPIAFVPEPEPVLAAPEPIAFVPDPEPVLVAPEPIALAPEPVAVAPEPVISDLDAMLAELEHVAIGSEADSAPEPIAAAPEPVVETPEPVAAPPETVVPPAKPSRWRAFRSGKKAPAPDVVETPVAARAPEPPPAPKAKAPPAPPVVLRPLKRLPPLAMWAHIDEGIVVEAHAPPPHARHDDDDVAGLIGALRVPAHVLAVSYPRRPYIHQVRS
jgi:hypothetical protein